MVSGNGGSGGSILHHNESGLQRRTYVVVFKYLLDGAMTECDGRMCKAIMMYSTN